jgi:hypothetical protein
VSRSNLPLTDSKGHDGPLSTRMPRHRWFLEPTPGLEPGTPSLRVPPEVRRAETARSRKRTTQRFRPRPSRWVSVHLVAPCCPLLPSS